MYAITELGKDQSQQVERSGGCLELNKRECRNCKHLGVTDSSNIYVSCNECSEWKEKLQEKPGENVS